MPSRLAILIALALAPLQTPQAPPATPGAPSPYPRVAAVQFALKNGWEFPKTNVVVANEAFFGAVDGHPDRKSIADQEKEALEIAKLLGPDVKTAWAVQKLDCPQGPGRRPCYAKDISVVVVGGLYVDQPSSGIQVYSPGGTMKHAVIELEKRETGWVGTRYSLGPGTLTRRGRGRTTQTEIKSR